MKKLSILTYSGCIGNDTPYTEHQYMGCFDNENKLNKMFEDYFGECTFSIDRNVGKLHFETNAPQGVVNVYCKNDTVHSFYIEQATPNIV